MLPPGLNFAVMATGYLLVMITLAVGVWLSRRDRGPGHGRDRVRAGGGGGRRQPAARRGWPYLVRRVAGTAVGGYVVLMAVVVGYYEGVAGLGGDFLAAAFTESALLVATTVPAFLLLTWAVVWSRRRRRR